MYLLEGKRDVRLNQETISIFYAVIKLKLHLEENSSEMLQVAGYTNTHQRKTKRRVHDINTI